MIDLARQGKVKDALELYEKEAPAQYLKNWMRRSIDKSLKGLYMKARGLEFKYPLSSFKVPAILSQTMRKKTNKTIVLVGEPGSGKTKYLIAHCREVLNVEPLIINNIDGLRFYNGQSVIILDDVA
jgi:type IV secretory pathway ATPase VirB11/archaellum biosynthesis ATPase